MGPLLIPALARAAETSAFAATDTFTTAFYIYIRCVVMIENAFSKILN